MREWTRRHEETGVDNAGVDNAGASMYKRRGRATPALPTSAEADDAVRNSRYAQLSSGEFYCGLADAGENGSALVFASDDQLELLRCATQIYFDATFKVVPTIYYQLFTLFVPFADSSFLVLYALMSRKTQALYVTVFRKVLDLVPQFAPTYVPWLTLKRRLCPHSSKCFRQPAQWDVGFIMLRHSSSAQTRSV